MKKILIIIFLASTFVIQTDAQKSESHPNFKYKKGHYYLLNEKGKVNKEIEAFCYAEAFREGLALVEKDLKFGFINITGKHVIPFIFSDASSFENGLTYAAINVKYGYVNKQGELVIAPQYEQASNFEGEYADIIRFSPRMSDNGIPYREEAVIDKKGDFLAGRYFTSIPFSEEKDCFKATHKDSSFFVSKEDIITFEKLIEEKEYLIVEEMPSFPSEEYEMRKIIASGVKYPISAINNKIDGDAK